MRFYILASIFTLTFVLSANAVAGNIYNHPAPNCSLEQAMFDKDVVNSTPAPFVVFTCAGFPKVPERLEGQNKTAGDLLVEANHYCRQKYCGDDLRAPASIEE